MTKTQSPGYRKSQSGQWVVFGPTGRVKVGQVTVAKKGGTTKVETIASVGKPFLVDGVECCYGYISQKSSAPAGMRRPTGRTNEDHEDCLSFGACGPLCAYASLLAPLTRRQ